MLAKISAGPTLIQSRCGLTGPKRAQLLIVGLFVIFFLVYGNLQEVSRHRRSSGFQSLSLLNGRPNTLSTVNKSSAPNLQTALNAATSFVPPDAPNADHKAAVEGDLHGLSSDNPTLTKSVMPDSSSPHTQIPFPALPQADEEEHIALCLMVKNQSIDLPEFFIHHYHHHGIRRFYIYDDGSLPPLNQKPYISSWGIPDSAIHFTYIDSHSNRSKDMQANTYTTCVETHGRKHKWMGFFDPDEFLEMRGEDPPTLKEWLQSWELDPEVGALGVHWLTHNSAGHLKSQPGNARKAYTTCLSNERVDGQLDQKCPGGPNRHVKSFVRTDRFDGFENIHWVKTTNGTKEVSEYGHQISTWCHRPISHSIWALHHYATKSREDYDLKKSRHRIEGGEIDDWWWNEYHQTSPNYTCPEMAAYIP